MLEISITSPNGQTLRKLELNGERTVTIGRAEGCDIRINSPVVSRRHAEISSDADGEWTLRDLGSTHGSFVGDQRITEVEITAGMTVRVGPARLRFDNLASRIGRELDAMLQDDEAESGPVEVEIIGRNGHHKVGSHDDTVR
ncbi:MAG: FHA domain-containing protein [Planctomycetota bacterium]